MWGDMKKYDIAPGTKYELEDGTEVRYWGKDRTCLPNHTVTYYVFFDKRDREYRLRTREMAELLEYNSEKHRERTA